MAKEKKKAKTPKKPAKKKEQEKEKPPASPPVVPQDTFEDLDKWDKDELIQMAASRGIKASKFTSKKKIIKAIIDATPAATMQAAKSELPDEVVDALKEVNDNATKDLPPKEPPAKGPRFRIKHFIVTYMGPDRTFEHSPLQHTCKLEFQRDMPVDIEESVLARIGTRHPDRIKLAKQWTRELSEEYRKIASRPGSYWKYQEKWGPLPRHTEGGDGPVGALQKVLEGPVDEVMKYVRLLKEGKIEPLVPGNDVYDEKGNLIFKDISVTIHWLELLEKDSPNYRPTLTDWLFDESRETQGLERLKTGVRELPQEGEE